MNRFLNGNLNSGNMSENVKHRLTARSFIAIKSHRTNQVRFLYLGYGFHHYGRRKSLTRAYSTISDRAVSVANLMHGKISGVMVGWSETKDSVNDMSPHSGGAILILEYALKRSKLCLRHPFKYGKT